MRRMSFMLTGPQMEAKTKTVTRRFGWSNLKPGTELLAVSKCQGLKPGEKAIVYGVIRVKSVSLENLSELERPSYGCVEANKEGFSDMSGVAFIKMFCEKMKCREWKEVNRIEFEHLY